VGQNYPGSDREHYRRVENECFGLPNGGMIVAVVIGLIIILAGVGALLNIVYQISFDIWPFILIIFGVLILIGGIYSRRRYTTRHPT
jgi:ABC-type antimicrobial peptide transport system permease subunit